MMDKTIKSLTEVSQSEINFAYRIANRLYFKFLKEQFLFLAENLRTLYNSEFSKQMSKEDSLKIVVSFYKGRREMIETLRKKYRLSVFESGKIWIKRQWKLGYNVLMRFLSKYYRITMFHPNEVIRDFYVLKELKRISNIKRKHYVSGDLFETIKILNGVNPKIDRKVNAVLRLNWYGV